MSKKTGIRMSPPIENLLKNREHDTLTGRLSTVAERYMAIIEAHQPDFSKGEWSAVRDALNGVWLRDNEALRFIWAEISDADRLEHLGEKWGIDAQALAAKIREMTMAELIALVEIVEQWWADQ